MNMEHRRFRNTLEALQDCADHMQDGTISPDELKARDQLINLCTEISGDYGGDEEVE